MRYAQRSKRSRIRSEWVGGPPQQYRDDPSGTGPALEALGVGFLERITDAPLFF
jgi:hypothetical protein